MLRSVVGKMVHDQWRALAVWTALAGLLAAFYLSLYPSLGSVEEMRRLLDAMPPELRAMFSAEGSDLSTPAGYLNIELFTFMLPLIVMAITIAIGAGATAGEEERGTLELLLANPVPRWRIVIEKALGAAALAAVLCAGVWVALAAAAQLIDVDIALERVAAALASVWLLACAIGAVAMLVGALTGRRTMSIAVALGAAILGFFLNALAPLSDVLEPWRALSPHYHYIGYDPLGNGLDLGHALVLAAISVVMVALAAFAFERRDLRS
ncbi:MAG: ABC transporter permease subunit [Candidatus Limnocylindrales bacterium]